MVGKVASIPTFENLGTSDTLVFIGCHLSKGLIAVDGDYGTSLNHGGYVLFVALRLFRLYERMVVGKVASMLQYVFFIICIGIQRNTDTRETQYSP